MQRPVDARTIGFGIGTATAVVMAVHAAVASLTGHNRAEDLWAYVVLLGGTALVFTVVGWRGGVQAGWGYLVPAFGAALATDNGLPSHGIYAGLFVLATVLTQVVPIWRTERAHRRQARSTSGADAFRAMTTDADQRQ